MITRRRFALTTAAASLLPGAALRAAELRMVRARRKPADQWNDYPTRTLDAVEGFRPGARKIEVDLYGGRTDRRQKATGFFHPVKAGSRWYLVDPLGNLYLQSGICSLTTGKSAANRRNLAAKFGTPETWAMETSDLLRANGITGSGGWSDVDVLATAPHRLAWCTLSNFMGNFGRSLKLTHQQAGHLGYVNDCIPVFHPGFADSCEKTARKLELPAPADMLDKYLQLDADDPGRLAAAKWLAERNRNEPNEEDRTAFLGVVYDRYFRVTAAATRKHDPNHMCLGPRMHGPFLKANAVMQAAGRSLDVLSLNVYHYWDAPKDLMAMWSGESGKPFLVTEWYTKGEDSGYPNTSGAGWNVPTQQDRGYFYQNFALGLLESKTCVGWHWFKYLDNDPDDKTTDPSNRDSNKGLVNLRYDPYPDLLNAMRALNHDIYALADHFER